MTFTVQARGVAAMTAAVALFAVSAAMVAALPVGGLPAVCLTSLGSGLALGAYTYARRLDRSQVPAGTVALLTALNLTQIGLYYLALKLAPAGPAAALHLSAPVMLLAWAVARRQRTFGPRELVTVTLVAAGLAGAALSVPASDGTEPLLGLALALASAVAFAAMISLVFMRAPKMSLQYCNAIKGVAGGLLLAPVLAADMPSAADSAVMLAVGAVIIAPGLGLAWYALARVHPTTTSTIDLLEAVFTPAAGLALFALPVTATQALAMLPLIGAALLEIRRPAVGAVPAPAAP